MYQFQINIHYVSVYLDIFFSFHLKMVGLPASTISAEIEQLQQFNSNNSVFSIHTAIGVHLYVKWSNNLC